VDIAARGRACPSGHDRSTPAAAFTAPGGTGDRHGFAEPAPAPQRRHLFSSGPWWSCG